MAGVDKLVVGCGYLGQRVAQTWVAQGDRVFGLVQSESRASQLRDAGIVPLVADVTQLDTLPAFPEVQTVLYCVATGRGASASQTSKRAVYVDGLQNVLNRLGSGYERLIYISSTSVYGQTGGEWVDERSPCHPVSPGGRICLEAEEGLRRFFAESGDVSRSTYHILRLSGLYGPTRLRSRVEQVRSGRPLDGNPDAWLNLIHVDDAVRAVLACEQRGRPGEVLIVSDDRPLTRREYYQALASSVGTDTIRWAQAAAEQTEVSQHLNKRCCNRRLREELKVELEYPTFFVGLPNAVGV